MGSDCPSFFSIYFSPATSFIYINFTLNNLSTDNVFNCYGDFESNTTY